MGMNMKFTVTAGHSSTEPGNTWNGQREADLMDDLGAIIAKKLREKGHEVSEDGPRGENWPLAQAVRLIAGSDLAIELHTNGSANPAAGGVEVVAPLRHRPMAQRIAKAIASTLDIPVRRDGGFYDPEVHRKDRQWNAQAAFVRGGGLIVEVFFQSNAAELAAYQAKKWLVAEAIARALTGE